MADRTNPNEQPVTESTSESETSNRTIDAMLGEDDVGDGRITPLRVEDSGSGRAENRTGPVSLPTAGPVCSKFSRSRLGRGVHWEA